MFVRAGGGMTPKKPATSNDPMSHATCHIASALTSNKPPATTLAGRVGDSPAKEIESRFKCYQQLAGLKNLVESGLLSAEEYISEWQAIMDTLHKLKGK